MNPIIFEANSTKFDSLGLGIIQDVVECNVIEGLNGTYELNLRMLSSDKNFNSIRIGAIIGAIPNQYDNIQAFVIESISKNLDGIVEIYATHIAQHRAKLIPINNYSASSLAQAITRSKTNSLENNPFNLTTNKTSSADFKIDEPRSFRELLGGREGSFLDVYGGEYYYDNFDIQLLSRRGQDTNVRILYGLNMVELDVDDEFSFDTSITGILPIWFSEEDGLVKGAIQYSSNALSEAYAKTIVVDMSDYFENKPTASQLNARAQSLIVSRGLDKRNLKVSFEQIQQFSTGDNIQIVQGLQLGDTITVIYELYDINYQSRIIETDYDVLLERYNSMTIGDKRSTINEAISNITNNSIYSVEAEIVRLQDNKVSKVGDTMTGDLVFDKTKGIYGIDSSDTQYPIIADNYVNLWIGAKQTRAKHHVGRTYISTGYDSTNSEGYPTIYVSVPNSSNDNATNYDVWHNGYLPVSQYSYSSFTYSTGFEQYATSGTQEPKASKFGRFVNLTGAIKNLNQISASQQTVIGKVPKGCEPLNNVRVVENGSGVNKFLLVISTDGNITVERYGTTSNIAIPASSWLNICCSYISAS